MLLIEHSINNITPRQDGAPALRVYGNQAHVVADVIRKNPHLAARFLLAPRRAVHAVVAYLHLSKQAFAERITAVAEEHPRELLRSVIPDAPPELYRSLDKAGDQARGHAYYQRLGRLCGTRLARTLLASHRLGELEIECAEAVLQSYPQIIGVHESMPLTRRFVKALETLFSVLHAHNIPVEGWQDFPSGSGMSSVKRRLQVYLDQLIAPDCGFDVPAPFQIIRSVAELRAQGQRLKNCVQELDGIHYFSLTEGTVVYIAYDASPFLASLRRVGPKVYLIDEVLGVDNDDVGLIAREMLLAVLRNAGVAIVSYTPRQALDVIDGMPSFMTEYLDPLEDVEDEAA